MKCTNCGIVDVPKYSYTEHLCEKCYKEEQERRHNTFLLNRHSAFDSGLSSIVSVDIPIVPSMLEKRPYRDMPVFKYSGITKSTNKGVFDRFVVIDVETTGLKPYSHEIVELSAIYYENLSPVDSYNTLVRPNKKIPPDATAVNGLTDDVLSSAPVLSDVACGFVEYLHGLPIVGYNLEFDLKFLYCSGIDIFSVKHKLFDAMSLVRKHYTDLYNYSLLSACENINVYPSVSHRGIADCYATGLVFLDLLDEILP